MTLFDVAHEIYGDRYTYTGRKNSHAGFLTIHDSGKQIPVAVSASEVINCTPENHKSMLRAKVKNAVYMLEKQ